MSVEVGLGLGSNIGEKAARIREAVFHLQDCGAIRDLRLSGLYRTEPWGCEAQDWFVNACCLGTTDLPPLELLAVCLDVETRMGRRRTVRWGPRIIDIDLLFYDSLHATDRRLTLPHPEIRNRAFVLVPLAELCPGLDLGGITVSQALESVGARGILPIDTC